MRIQQWNHLRGISLMNKLLIYGAGGLGRGIIELIDSINQIKPNTWEIIGFVDDQAKGVINEYKVWGTTEDLLQITEDISIVLAIGNPQTKKNIYEKIKTNSKIHYPNLIHPSVEFSKFNIIGQGNVISKGVSMSTNIEINDFNLIHYNCSIGHDVYMGSYNSVFPLTSLSGYVLLENEIEIGANTSILPSVVVGEKAVIGAGSVLLTNIPNNVTAVGVPARIIKE